MLRRATVLAVRAAATAAPTSTSTAVRAFSSGALVQPTRSPPPAQSMRPHKLPGDPTHTEKWLFDGKSPMDSIAEVAPIAIHNHTAVCYGSDDTNLGHPVEYICLNDVTTPEHPATCKYCGLRYFQVPH
jgi:uncharacterized Zn-finger protein